MYKYKTDETIPKVEIIKNTLEIDWKLYKKLLRARSHSKSAEEILFRNWLKAWIETHIDNVKTYLDKAGNLCVIKGDATLYPCVVAHMDINQDEVKELSIIQTDKFIIGLNNETGKQCGLGHDDKAGIMFGLVMLQTLDVVKCFFSLDEEMGCLGTKKADMSFFENCSMMVQLDRNSYSNDISYYTNGVFVVSEEFKKAVSPVVVDFNYDWEYCAYTDIGELIKQKAGCVGMNISCGYYNEHMDDEILSINHYINAVHFAYELIREFGYEKRWKHVAWEKEKVPSYSSPKTTAVPAKLSERWSDYYDWEEEKPSINDKKPRSIKEELLLKKDVYHHSDHYNFVKEDEDSIIQSIVVGTCPICNTIVTELEDGEFACGACESVFYIPQGKSVIDCLEELDAIYEG